MFARYYVEIGMEPERVERAVLRDPQSWLPGLASDANRQGDALLAEVGFGEAMRVARTVSIEFSPPVRMPGKTIVPLRWRATGPPGLFPSLEADLEIGRLGADRTQLAINARYAPPLGALGRAMDRALLHRVAEATLKDFLDNVAVALTEQVAAL